MSKSWNISLELIYKEPGSATTYLDPLKLVSTFGIKLCTPWGSWGRWMYLKPFKENFRMVREYRKPSNIEAINKVLEVYDHGN